MALVMVRYLLIATAMESVSAAACPAIGVGCQEYLRRAVELDRKPNLMEKKIPIALLFRIKECFCSAGKRHDIIVRDVERHKKSAGHMAKAIVKTVHGKYGFVVIKGTGL